MGSSYVWVLLEVNNLARFQLGENAFNSIESDLDYFEQLPTRSERFEPL